MCVVRLVVQPMDDILYSFSNASFAACPDVFPPDNFNSGVLVQLLSIPKSYAQIYSMFRRSSILVKILFVACWK